MFAFSKNNDFTCALCSKEYERFDQANSCCRKEIMESVIELYNDSKDLHCYHNLKYCIEKIVDDLVIKSPFYNNILINDIHKSIDALYMVIDYYFKTDHHLDEPFNVVVLSHLKDDLARYYSYLKNMDILAYDNKEIEHTIKLIDSIAFALDDCVTLHDHLITTNKA